MSGEKEGNEARIGAIPDTLSISARLSYIDRGNEERTNDNAKLFKND